MGHPRSRCPCCNSVLGGAGFRLGVRLPRTQLLIYDAVRRSGPSGVSSNALQDRLGLNGDNLKAQIWNLNENLELVGYRVRAGVAHANYRVVRWK